MTPLGGLLHYLTCCLIRELLAITVLHSSAKIFELFDIADLLLGAKLKNFSKFLSK